MKKYFVKLLSLLFIITNLFSKVCAMGISFRHALQISCEYMQDINSCAILVNSLPTEQLDIMLNGQKIGTVFYPKSGDSIIYAFKNVQLNDEDISSLTGEIQKSINDNKDKEFIFTGYGKGANFAAKVASRVMNSQGNINQIKIIVFCAEDKIRDDLRHMYLSCKLHFFKRDEKPCYDSSVIEINMAPTITERFSFPKFAIGTAALVGINLFLNKYDKDEKTITEDKGTEQIDKDAEKPKNTKKVRRAVNVVGALGVAAFSLSKQQNQYFPGDEIGSRFKRAQSRAWGCDTAEEWRHIGD